MAPNYRNYGQMQGQISRSPSSTKLWRTEQTYRGWGRRFAAWLAPRAMESATDDDVRAFLSHLVLDGDVAAATQRQALNALVFFLRTHLDAIRSLFDEDRACGMAGVWLPPAHRTQASEFRDRVGVAMGVSLPANGRGPA